MKDPSFKSIRLYQRTATTADLLAGSGSVVTSLLFLARLDSLKRLTSAPGKFAAELRLSSVITPDY